MNEALDAVLMHFEHREVGRQVGRIVCFQRFRRSQSCFIEASRCLDSVDPAEL